MQKGLDGRQGHVHRNRRRRLVRSTLGRSLRREYAAAGSATHRDGKSRGASGSSHRRKNSRAQKAIQWRYAPWGAFLARGSIRALGVGAIFAVVFAHVALPAHANGILDNVQAAVSSTTVAWMNNSLQLATALFSIMITVSLVTAIARYAALNHTLEGFGHVFMDLFIKVIPLYVIMAGSTTFLPNIVNFANEIGGQITGTPVIGPSEIFGYGVAICKDILSAAAIPVALAGVPVVGEVSLFTSQLLGIVALVTSFVTISAFALIAFEYVFAFVQAYITLSIGAFSLGWLGSTGTRHMGESYLGAAWMSIMRIIITIGVVGFIVQMVPHMAEKAATGDIKTILMSWVELCGATVFAALLATKVPSFATHVFTGHPAISAPAVANSAVRQGSQAARTAAGAV